MQYELPLEGASRLTEIHRRLMAAYGPPLPTFRLVVDTHYWRVARRFGLISPKTSLAKSSQLLTRQIPSFWTADDTEKNFIFMKKLGQEYCHHAAPDCARCPLQSICPHAAVLRSSNDHDRHV